MKPTPRITDFLIGAIIGACVGGLTRVYGSFLVNTVEMSMELLMSLGRPAIMVSGEVLVVMLSLGFALFLILRRMGWLSLWPTTIIGGSVGAVTAGGLLLVPSKWVIPNVLAGILASMTCYLTMLVLIQLRNRRKNG